MGILVEQQHRLAASARLTSLTLIFVEEPSSSKAGGFLNRCLFNDKKYSRIKEKTGRLFFHRTLLEGVAFPFHLCMCKQQTTYLQRTNDKRQRTGTRRPPESPKI